MKMTKQQLSRCAQNLLKTLREHELESLERLEATTGDVFDPDADDRYHGEEYVSVDAEMGSISVRYARRIGQVPITLRVNTGRVKIMLTCTEALEGYEVFDEEPEFGKMQDRTFASYEAARNELEDLATLQ